MKKLKAFTLIELLITISVISILTGVGFSQFKTMRERARDTQRISDLEHITSAIKTYAVDNDHYPAITGEEIHSIDSIAGSLARYMREVPTDPSGDGIIEDGGKCAKGGTSYAYYADKGEYAVTTLLEIGTGNTMQCKGIIENNIPSHYKTLGAKKGTIGNQYTMREKKKKPKISGQCGSADNSNSETKPTGDSLCKTGIPKRINESGPRTWKCENDSKKSKICSTQKIIKGICGSAKDKPTTIKPTKNLCQGGTIPNVTFTNNERIRHCPSQYTENTKCSAEKLPAIDGVCGSATETQTVEPPTEDLCAITQNPEVTANNNQRTRTCEGNQGKPKECHSTRLIKKQGKCKTEKYQCEYNQNANIMDKTYDVGSIIHNWTCPGINTGKESDNCTFSENTNPQDSCNIEEEKCVYGKKTNYHNYRRSKKITRECRGKNRKTGYCEKTKPIHAQCNNNAKRQCTSGNLDENSKQTLTGEVRRTCKGENKGSDDDTCRWSPFRFNNEGRLWGYKGTAPSNLIIPKNINNTTITSILGSSFYKKNIKSVTIPNSIINIGEDAFMYNKITTINIPDSVKKIGKYAFGANEIKSINLGNNVEEIGPMAFGRNRIRTINIPDSVKKIGSQAFFNNKIESVKIGKNVKEIGKWAFMRNSEIKTIFIPNGIEKIDTLAFGRDSTPRKEGPRTPGNRKNIGDRTRVKQ